MLLLSVPIIQTEQPPEWQFCAAHIRSSYIACFLCWEGLSAVKLERRHIPATSGRVLFKPLFQKYGKFSHRTSFALFFSVTCPTGLTRFPSPFYSGETDVGRDREGVVREEEFWRLLLARRAEAIAYLGCNCSVHSSKNYVTAKVVEGFS